MAVLVSVLLAGGSPKFDLASDLIPSVTFSILESFPTHHLQQYIG